MSARALSDVDSLFRSARAGSNSSLGRLLSLYSNYLKLLVAAQMDHRLRVRVSPSDILQETFFEAHRDFAQFRGQSTGEFVAWLRKIVVNNILRVVEQHVHAEKRDVRREVSLEEIGRRLEQSTARLETLLAVDGESPSGCAVRNEHEILLADAFSALPADYRDVIVMRHIEGLPFEDVARRMQRTSGAVRMLWLRALKTLRENIGVSAMNEE
jgi:RNA polymerase sigma-70 factor, ECF subfamily